MLDLNLENLMSNKFLIVGIIAVLVIVFVSIHYLQKSQENIENNTTEAQKELPLTSVYVGDEEVGEDSKVLHYYGGKNCPHSNMASALFTLLHTSLKREHPDVVLKIYWSDEMPELFQNNNIEYVPTVLNSKNDKVFIGLPDGVDKDNHTDKELEKILVDNIYNQL